ncbi:MAG: hypothetical protein JWO70_4607 [Betaproteobacteria bacterium]|jgi:hypothetical protein|nr:hypothetical protein [Betaproteobacteria bacterium]
MKAPRRTIAVGAVAAGFCAANGYAQQPAVAGTAPGTSTATVSGTDPRNFVVGGSRLDNDHLYSDKDVKVGLNDLLPKDFTIGAFYSKACDANVLGYGSADQIGARGNRGAYPRNIGKGVGILLAP